MVVVEVVVGVEVCTGAVVLELVVTVVVLGSLEASTQYDWFSLKLPQPAVMEGFLTQKVSKQVVHREKANDIPIA